MASSIVQTVNREDTSPLATTFSDLSIVPFPPASPVMYLLRTAGQVGTPPPSSSSTGAAVPSSFSGQARNAFDNLAACLAVGGATPQDVTKITIFVVNLDASVRGPLIDILTSFFTNKDGHHHRPPSALIGVAALASPEFVIEVEAEAAISAR